MNAEVIRETPSRWMARYVQDHYAASRGGLALVQRASQSHSDPVVRRELAELAVEVAEDRAVLRTMMDDLGVPTRDFQERLVLVAERVGRLKPNGTALRRSPLSDLVELEGMTAAVRAKRLGWTALREVAETVPTLNPYQLDELIHRARKQESTLEGLRLETARRVFVRS